MRIKRTIGLFLLSGLLTMSLLGCIRKYDVKFSVAAPETIAESATNYQ